jgi:hypothetical protein
VVAGDDLLERPQITGRGPCHDHGRDVVGRERVSHTKQMIRHGELSQSSDDE